jgi:molecular chaperone GrpE
MISEGWILEEADMTTMTSARPSAAQTARLQERVRVAREWLLVLDDLDLALEHADSDSRKIVDAVLAVRDHALAVMARLGFPRQVDVGQAFDPRRHEAVATVVDPGAEPGTVLHVVRPGYGDEEHQLRPASVVVAARRKR